MSLTEWSVNSHSCCLCEWNLNIDHTTANTSIVVFGLESVTSLILESIFGLISVWVKFCDITAPEMIIDSLYLIKAHIKHAIPTTRDHCHICERDPAVRWKDERMLVGEWCKGEGSYWLFCLWQAVWVKRSKASDLSALRCLVSSRLMHVTLAC